jgi:putative SOS response-associated peptidase YedK
VKVIAPSRDVPVIVRNEKRYEFRPMRWGLAPSWSQDRSIGQRMINARSETLLEKPSSALTTGDGWRNIAPKQR